MAYREWRQALASAAMPSTSLYTTNYTNQSDFDGQGSGTPDCFLGWDGARAETLRDYKQC